MKRLFYLVNSLLFTAFFVVSVHAQSQTITRQPTETAEAFVKRTFNIDELPHPVIETGEWDNTKKAIIFFKPVDNTENEAAFVGYLLSPSGNSAYGVTIIDTFYHWGGQRKPTIETVFFANADNDSAREIIIMVKAEVWLPRTAEQSWEGYFYETYIYDNPVMSSPVERLHYFEKISSDLSTGFEGKKYNKQTGKLISTETAKYKTVSSIRQALKNMGYPPVAPKH